MRLALPLILVLLLVAPSAADVVTTTEGLVLEGTVERDAAGRYVVTTDQGKTVLEPARVKAFRPGQSPRRALETQAATLEADDVAGWYRLGLEAAAAGFPDLAASAYRKVVQQDADHLAARRALGHEKVDGTWMEAAAAHRRRGLVRYGGQWRLPAEVELVAQKAPVATKADGSAQEVIEALATGDDVLRRAARLSLAKLRDETVVPAALSSLLDRDPAVRKTAARLLGEVGDEVALRPLIFSAARDLDADVRGEALRAAQTFGHDDLAIPFVRALGSENLQLVGHAAEALAAIGDVRAVGWVVKRITNCGGPSRRMTVSFVNQVSYVRDYDVEIAQASNIANPDVATVLEGVVLDVRVIASCYSRTWVEPILIRAAGQLAGRSFRNRDEVLAWYATAKDTLPAFPEDAKRARKSRGKVVGAT